MTYAHHVTAVPSNETRQPTPLLVSYPARDVGMPPVIYGGHRLTGGNRLHTQPVTLVRAIGVGVQDSRTIQCRKTTILIVSV